MTNTSARAPLDYRAALAELEQVLSAVLPATVDTLCDELEGARRIVLYGVGREGLMMRALAMRLMHLGLDAHVAGDMSTPPVGHDDVLVVSAGPGEFSTVLALQEVARNAGARCVVVTAQAGGRAARRADTVIHLPARTMADDRARPGFLPMGSAFEAAELVFFDLVALRFRDRSGQSAEQMRSRHTNLE